MASTETKTGDADMHPDIGAMTKGLQAEHLRRAPGSAANPRLHRTIAEGSGVGAQTGHEIAGLSRAATAVNHRTAKSRLESSASMMLFW
jgi:hypothetical protein